MNKGITFSTFFLLLSFSFILVLASVNSQQAYSPDELFLNVYVDGVIRIEYHIKIDVTYPQIEISLFGTLYEDLIVEDENGLPLDYSLVENGISIYSLGASSAKITYFTPDLTNKSARFYILQLNSPINSNIILPEEATIISLNEVPITIGNLNGHSLLTMPKGKQEITYVVGVVGTRKYSLILINEVEIKIQEIKAKNIIVTDAEAKLLEAKEAYNLGKNAETEKLAKQAKELAIQIEVLAIEANTHIKDSESSIKKAQQEGRTTNLDEAQKNIQLAKDKYENGDYRKTLEFSDLAKIKAESSTVQPIFEKNIYLWILGMVLATIIISLFVFKFLRRSKHEKPIDTDEIFKKHPQMRYDDKEVILFLTEKGGKAFEAQIRERFNLPRTTSWRMVKRLQREGIIELQKVGGQNLLQIKPEYLTS
jgi:uncharacterized membrane protein